MDIGQSHERASRIFLVEKALREVNDKKLLLDYKKFWIEIADRWNITERTAKEYITIAKARIPEWMNYEWSMPTRKEETAK